jgi:hypothetical protein
MPPIIAGAVASADGPETDPVKPVCVFLTAKNHDDILSLSKIQGKAVLVD